MTETESRRLHFVGTLPQFENARADFESTELDGALRRWYSGETGARLEWFVPVVKGLKRSPKIRVVRDGDWTGEHDGLSAETLASWRARGESPVVRGRPLGWLMVWARRVPRSCGPR